MIKPPSVSRKILPVIVLSQFCCTSLWFAGNGVMDDLIHAFSLQENSLGHLTSAVQLGFISGTLVFALLTVADRFSPSRVFFASALAGAICNSFMIWEGNTLFSLLGLRFATGFFLAGIYPVGMKIASDYYKEGLGRSLGYLVGALVLGTAFPHLLKELTSSFPWQRVIMGTTGLAMAGGTSMILLVPDGPFRQRSQQLDLSAFFKVFQDRSFRSAAFGYFGHMWELYAFWAFIPVLLITFLSMHPDSTINISLMSFLTIGIGGAACIAGGYISEQLGLQRTAFLALLLSAICCLISPLVIYLGSLPVLILFLLFWGATVIADSPLFSTLVAHNAQPAVKGTALTIVNSIGFAITIASIQLLTWMYGLIDPVFIFMFLAVGPITGLVILRKNRMA